jgi:hypothetical protein
MRISNFGKINSEKKNLKILESNSSNGKQN